MKSCLYCSLKNAENQVFLLIFSKKLKKTEPIWTLSENYCAATPFSAVNSIFSGLDLLSEPM